METWNIDVYTFPEIIRETRKQRNLTQTELAKAANVNLITIVNYENGYKIPQIPTLIKVAAALGITEIKFDTTKKWY